MNTGEIKILMEKYLNGNSTLEEQKRLKTLLLSEDSPKEMLPLKEQFLFMEEMRSVHHPDNDFEEKLKARIEEESAVIPISSRKRILWFAGVAAGIIIIIAAFFQLNRVVMKVEDTYSNPETAYQQTKKILMYVSNKLNKGTEDLAKVEKLESGLDALSPVDKINTGLEEAEKITRYNQIEKVFGTTN
jgi:hypothetical protein